VAAAGRELPHCAEQARRRRRYGDGPPVTEVRSLDRELAQVIGEVGCQIQVTLRVR
jgi:hypothetical protein